MNDYNTLNHFLLEYLRPVMQKSLCATDYMNASICAEPSVLCFMFNDSPLWQLDYITT